jgi:hypothetical protein
MKTRTFASCLAASIFLLTPVRFASANSIVNGDFETGDFTGWTATGPNIFVDHGPGPDTTFGAFFGANANGFNTISQTFATTAGASYKLTFFYQITNLGTPIPANNEFDVLWNGVSIGGGLFPQANVNPGFGTFTFTEKATGTSTTLAFEGFNAPSFFFLDSVSVNAPDSGSSALLLSFGLVALLLVRAVVRTWARV